MLARLLNEKKGWEGLGVSRTQMDKHSLRSPGGAISHSGGIYTIGNKKEVGPGSGGICL